MPQRRTSAPKYRLHKPTGQAVVTIRIPSGKRKDIYLGPFNSEESLEEYRRILAQLASGQPTSATPPPACPTVAELLVGFLRHAAENYRTPDGRTTPRYSGVVRSLKKLRELYAHLPAIEFKAGDLKAIRTALVADGLSREVVNARVQLVRKVFKWAVGEDLIEPDIYQRLQAVEGLKAGRTEAPDLEPILPADPQHVTAALPHMPPYVAAIVRLQRMTAARCGELCILRPRDIDKKNPAAWEYRPTGHKGTWREKGRTIYFGKRCQELLAAFLLKAGEPDAYVFSPVRAEAERNAAKSEARKTPRYPSHMARNATKRKKARRSPIRQKYGTATVRQAIERACTRAGVPIFTPHQLRHLAATEIRAEFGPEVARAMLGHSLAAMTERYSADVDRGLAMKAVERFG